MALTSTLIRPFNDLGEFKEALSETQLVIGSTVVQSGERVTVQVTDWNAENPAIVFSPNCTGEEFRERLLKAAEVAGLELSEVELVAIVTSPYLRLLDIAFRVPIGEPGSVPDMLDLRRLPDPPRALQATRGGCDVSLVALLAVDRPNASAFEPRRKGTWLGRADFKVRTDRTNLGFAPVLLTDDIRESFGLGPNVTQFIEIDDLSGLVGDRLDDVLTVYVDEEMLVSASRDPGSPTSVLFQAQILRDILRAVAKAASDWSELENLDAEAIKDTLLGDLVEFVCTDTDDQIVTRPRTAEAALRILASDPDRFAAHAEDAAGVGDMMRSALKGERG